MYVKKKHLKKRFGTTDVEGLALDMYNTFHNHTPDYSGWTPYKKWKCDPVVQSFRMAALIAAESVEYDCIGTIYYEDVV